MQLSVDCLDDYGSCSDLIEAAYMPFANIKEGEEASSFKAQSIVLFISATRNHRQIGLLSYRSPVSSEFWSSEKGIVVQEQRVDP